MRYLSSLIYIAGTIPFMILSGCSGTQPTMHYYQLSPAVIETAAAVEFPDLALGVGPVIIPEMLKRQEIVVRGEGNKYRLVDLHRWAGLLEKDLNSVIIENLGQQLGTEQVVSFPWGPYFNPDYRIIIEVLELTGEPGASATLRASWTIIDRTGEQMLIRKISSFEQSPHDQSVNSLIEAENILIARLCQEISMSLRKLKMS